MKRVVYSVDVEVELDFDVQRRRIQVVPHVIEAYSKEDACERALIIEKSRFHEPRLVGEPRVITVRKVEFRKGW
ncbi:hypothetical protein HY623_04035 [Candidatus Uhrbacteria bacterium]|nr:hypothetical protein [Candidatus Uhrbacteria bacterium]